VKEVWIKAIQLRETVQERKSSGAIAAYCSVNRSESMMRGRQPSSKTAAATSISLFQTVET